jgi:hypothetical protein
MKMSEAMLGALFLTFAGAVGYSTYRLGSRNCSPVTHQLFGPVTTGGAIASFLAIYLYIKDQGVLYGLVYWVAAATIFIVIGSWLMDGLRSVLGLGALVVGGYFAVRAFL